MIPTTSALPGSGVTLSGRGPDDFKHVGLAGVRGRIFPPPRPYLKASRTELAVSSVWCQCSLQSGGVGEANGARSGETGESQDGARVRVEGREERELLNRAGMRRGAQWQARGLRGDHRQKRGDVEATARESLPEPVRSRVLRERASTRWRESVDNSPIPSIRAERAPVTPSVPLPNRGVCCVARACASWWRTLERAHRPRQGHEVRRGYARHCGLPAIAPRGRG